VGYLPFPSGMLLGGAGISGMPAGGSNAYGVASDAVS